jgi:hypothetical protein
MNEKKPPLYLWQSLKLPPGNRVKTKAQFRGGAVKMQRRGHLGWRDQRIGPFAGRAPETRGLWAFIAPYHANFFSWHKWDEVLPKRMTSEAVAAMPFTTDAERAVVWAIQEEKDAWIKKHATLMPVRNFWWEGELYTRFDINGEVDMEWTLMSVSHLAEIIGRVEYDHTYGTDHMEVFISPKRGRIVTR